MPFTAGSPPTYTRLFAFVDQFLAGETADRADFDTFLADLEDSLNAAFAHFASVPAPTTDSRYLGRKNPASPPTTRNDASPLVDGDFFASSSATEPIFYVRSGSSWVRAADIPAASTFFKTLVTAADAATLRTLMGLAIGINVQGYAAALAAIAGVTPAANKMPYFTGASTAALADLSAFARTLLDDADATTARATLLLGTNLLSTSSAVTDADAATDSGFWRTDGAAANIPEATIGVGITAQYNASGLLQVWISLTTGGIWYRKKNITWSAWSQFVSSANFASSFAALPYVSSQQTITSGGLLTLAHGLGVVPSAFACRLKCVTAEHNWTVGDEMLAELSPSGSTAINSLWADATNVYVRYSNAASCFNGGNKTTGAATTLTNANWRLIVRAYP